MESGLIFDFNITRNQTRPHLQFAEKTYNDPGESLESEQEDQMTYREFFSRVEGKYGNKFPVRIFLDDLRGVVNAIRGRLDWGGDEITRDFASRLFSLLIADLSDRANAFDSGIDDVAYQEATKVAKAMAEVLNEAFEAGIVAPTITSPTRRFLQV